MVESAISDLERCLTDGGLNAGLKFLNSRVPHRFTGVFRLGANMLQKVCLVDKDAEVSEDAFLQEVPLGHSFCQFVLRDGALRTSLSSSLAMLDGHPYQGVLETYVGLPLMTGPSELFGTLCHFDFVSHPISDEEFEFLQKATQVIPPFCRPDREPPR
jgi:GAF domain-containing protein